ncbi:MAG: hypothetical protein HOC23_12425 [Halieaceae bacterium]|jgi:hypothetical protein|nr:hypothetical protein [Halieaceae bacterium]
MTRTIRLFLVVLAAFTLSCSQNDAENKDRHIARKSPATNEGVAGDERSTGNPSTQFDLQYGGDYAHMVGYYAEKVTITTLDEMPFFGESESTSHYYSLTRIGAIDGELFSRAQSCTSEVGGSWLAQVSISDEVTQKIAPITGKLSFHKEEGKLLVSREWVAVPLGITMDDPMNEDLPYNPNDSRVVDTEGDGKPGISVDIEILGGLAGTAQIYAIRIERGAWEAQVDENGFFRGTVKDDSMQRVIGASDEKFAQDLGSRHHPNPEKSTILLIPLDGDDWNCDKLIEKREEIYLD